MKVSLVYYVEITMSGKARVNMKLETSLFTTLKDLNAFNKLNYGNLLFDRTLKSLQKCFGRQI